MWQLRRMVTSDYIPAKEIIAGLGVPSAHTPLNARTGGPEMHYDY